MHLYLHQVCVYINKNFYLHITCMYNTYYPIDILLYYTRGLYSTLVGHIYIGGSKLDHIIVHAELRDKYFFVENGVMENR